MSHFNICSNIDNGVGLQKDAELLRDLLVEWGHTAKLVHYKKQGDIEEAPRARANIFLEVVAYNLVARRIADQNWLIPNPEWFAAWDHQNAISTFDKFLCKTHDAVTIMQRELKEYRNKVQYIGFESRDLYDPSIPRERKFLHLAGMSQYKNTQATVYAFSKVTIDDEGRPPLTVVTCYPDLCEFARDDEERHRAQARVRRRSEAAFELAPVPHPALGLRRLGPRPVGRFGLRRRDDDDRPPSHEFVRRHRA